MKSKLTRWLVLLLVLMAALPEVMAGQGLVRVDESEARKLAIIYFESKGTPSPHINLELDPYSTSTWIIRSYQVGKVPSLPIRYMMNSRGQIWPLNINSLTVVFRDEFPRANTEEDRKTLANEFVKLHSGQHVVVLHSTADIPGYANRPLDPDVANAIRGPTQVNGVFVLYTYEYFGGIVRRYTFTFDPQSVLTNAESAVIAEHIGAAGYHE